MSKEASKQLKGRTLSRAQAMQLLFQAESSGEALERVLAANDYLVSEGPADDYAQELAQGVEQHLSDFDTLIKKSAQNWDISRIGRVERMIMSVAIYEMLYVDGIDDAVAISEAVKIAKIFCADDSYKFINGILGAISRKAAHEI